MLKRDGKVYTRIVKNCSVSELIPILSQYSELKALLYTLIVKKLMMDWWITKL